MNNIEVQVVCKTDRLPAPRQFVDWANEVLWGRTENTALVIRIVDLDESALLNEYYRHRPGPTNVLSFTYDGIENISVNHLGDLVICGPVVEREADEQDKTCEAHWAHMVVHGILHLSGYDHEEQAQAIAMEAEETKVLLALGFSNPYEEAVAL